MGDAAMRFRKAAADIMRAAEHARRLPTIEGRKVHWCRGHKRLEPSGRWSYRIRTVEPMPRGKHITTWGWSDAECIARMHWALASYYRARGATGDWDACLERSANESVKVLQWDIVK